MQSLYMTIINEYPCTVNYTHIICYIRFSLKTRHRKNTRVLLWDC